MAESGADAVFNPADKLSNSRSATRGSAMSVTSAGSQSLAMSDSSFRDSQTVVPRGNKVLEKMQSRRPTMNMSHITRPGAVDADVGWSKAKRAMAELSAAGDLDGSFASSTKNYMTIGEKEERLQTIMSTEAHDGYECLHRHQLDAKLSSRMAIDTQQIKGTNIMQCLMKVNQRLTGYVEDLKECPSAAEDDTSFVDHFSLQQWQAQPGELKVLPPAISAELDCRLGVALPVSKKTKASIASALGGLLAAKEGMGLKVLNTSAKAAELSTERCFAARCGEFCLIGLVTGHGNRKQAGALTLLVAQEMPRAFFRSVGFARHKDMVRGLNEAFQKVHLSAAADIDVSMTGAAVTVVLIGKEQLWIAHVGNNRVVLALPDEVGNSRDFHFAPRELTEDHVLSVKKEFDRIKGAGGEVRKLMHDSICRLFVQDTLFPGLAFTRSIGDRIGHTVGVIHKPTVSTLRRKDLPKDSFLLLGAPGLWANVSEVAAVNWTSRNFSDPQAAITSLATEALTRWEDPDCKARGNLDKDTQESFCAFILKLQEEHEEPPPQSARKWVVGPAGELLGSPRRPWREVRSPSRHTQLRQMIPALGSLSAREVLGV
eukprot:TRINITY_DN7850_c0_g1_i1.p1 TRINITY_DN7850_c0_g1~~TRINITY_DN7850_c0_g1_i1.p1  ORF type:complete len:600 (-),score=112.68 TRINITY_DN7850_c0_g1_i1:363-2162(-)